MTSSNQKVLITAGADGIGRAIAETFVREGADVHVCDINEGAIAALNEGDGALRGTLGDVTRPEDVARIFDDALARFGGRLDVLVNNAGVAGPTAPIEDMEIQDWQTCLDVNLNGAFFCLKHAVPIMKAQGSGAIVNLSSSAGIFGFPFRSPYAVAKWGVIGLTKTLAMELGPFGIRVNAICPGSVNGPRIDRVIAAAAESQGKSPEEVRESYVRQVSMRTFVDAQDIAEMVQFICSDRGAKISGQALPVDGHTETLGGSDG